MMSISKIFLRVNDFCTTQSIFILQKIRRSAKISRSSLKIYSLFCRCGSIKFCPSIRFCGREENTALLAEYVYHTAQSVRREPKLFTKAIRAEYFRCGSADHLQIEGCLVVSHFFSATYTSDLRHIKDLQTSRGRCGRCDRGY